MTEFCKYCNSIIQRKKVLVDLGLFEAPIMIYFCNKCENISSVDVDY